MGNNSPLHDRNGESSKNGHDIIYNHATYRDYMVTDRPRKTSWKRPVILFTLDFTTLIILLGVGKTLGDWKEWVVYVTGILYVLGRVITLYFKMMTFAGKNSDYVRKGVKLIKEIFTE